MAPTPALPRRKNTDRGGSERKYLLLDVQSDGLVASPTVC